MPTYRVQLRWFGTIVLVVLSMVVVGVSVQAAETTWLNASLSLEKQADYTYGAGSSLPFGSPTTQGGVCDNKPFLVRKSTSYGLFTQFTDKVEEHCAYRTPGGFVSKATVNGYPLFRYNHTTTAGSLKYNAPGFTSLPVPNSSDALMYTSMGYEGSAIAIVRDAYSGLVGEFDKNTGKTTYTSSHQPSNTLRRANGSQLSINVYAVSFSENGRYMVARSTYEGIVRIDLESFSYRTIDSPFLRDTDVDRLQTAVSNDGRYVVYSQPAYGQFRIYDMNSCTATACTYRDLTSYMQSQLTGYTGAPMSVRFDTSDTLRFYASYQYISPTQTHKLGLFNLYLGSPTAYNLDYLALGDSFASGEGAYRYKYGTDIPDNYCHTSENSYAYLLRSRFGLQSGESVACSGATLWDITTVELKNYKNDPQANNKNDNTFTNEILNNFLPGYRAQATFVFEHKPRVITMSIGGNDIGFGGIIKKCVMTSVQECYATYEDRYELVQQIYRQYEPLKEAYKLLYDSGAPNTKLYIVGYPQIAEPDRQCAANVHFTSNEIKTGQQIVTILNGVVRQAATDVGAFYVDAERAFDGHKLCESSRDKTAVHGLTAGTRSPLPDMGPLASESYHPNILGHQLYSQAIADQTANFTKPMPAKITTAWTPPKPDSLAFVSSAPSIYRNIWITNNVDMLSSDVLYKDRLSSIINWHTVYPLKPNTDYVLAAYSERTVIKTVRTDANGDIQDTFTIPSSLPVGYHTLRVEGYDNAGEPVALQKVVYVAASPTDLDGDGTPNEDEECLVVEPAGVDVDKDGIDDACDGEIGPTPPVEPAPDPETPPLSTDKEPVEGAGETAWSSPLTVTHSSVTTPQVSATVSVASTPSSSATLPPTNPEVTESTVVSTSSPKPSTSVAGTSDVASPAVDPATTKVHNDPFAWIAALLAVGSLVAFGLFRLARKA